MIKLITNSAFNARIVSYYKVKTAAVVGWSENSNIFNIKPVGRRSLFYTMGYMRAWRKMIKRDYITKLRRVFVENIIGSGHLVCVFDSHCSSWSIKTCINGEVYLRCDIRKAPIEFRYAFEYILETCEKSVALGVSK